MYRTIEDFLTDWKYETEGTAKIFNLLTDESGGNQVHKDVRTLNRLAWHLTQTLTEMGHRAGLFTEDELEHAAIPLSTAGIAEAYAKYSEQVRRAVHSKWTDSSLTDMVEMYGEQWNKGTILRVLISHQTHHRGQMTIIMRMLGLPVPGLYGPSREEWVQIGMIAPE